MNDSRESRLAKDLSYVALLSGKWCEASGAGLGRATCTAGLRALIQICYMIRGASNAYRIPPRLGVVRLASKARKSLGATGESAGGMKEDGKRG